VRLFSTLLLAASLSAAPRDLQRVIPELMAKAEVPGVSVALIERGAIRWRGHFGVANAETRRRIDGRSIFEAASLGKPVFAYALLRLAERGVIDLDRPLARYLDEPLADERMATITARMVLSHTTGLQNEVMPGQTLQVHFTPGTRFSYSGAGFLYLQRVVERVTGKPLPELMRELVFEPLGMRDSGYVWRADYESRKVFGHSAAGVIGARRKPAAATVATLHTTAADYARFVIATMKSKTMLAPQVAVDAGCYFCLSGGTGTMSESLSWGLGWGLERTARGRAFWHWGENHGEFQTFAIGYPDGDGVVVLTNSGNGFSVMPEIVAAALAGEHPAFAWMGYEGYRAPSKVLLREIVARGAAAALAGGAADSLTEPQINRIGYALLANRRLADAIAIFGLNVHRFPDSFNAYDSLGEAYAAAGDAANAIANYQRSLELNPQNGNAGEMIAKLRATRD
jgi:CubicO group peptidase (beta-lactamase class C family)